MKPLKNLMSDFSRSSRLMVWGIAAAAILLVAFGFVLNPALVGRMLSSDGALDPYNANLLTIYNLLALITGTLVWLRLQHARGAGEGAVRSLAGNLTKSVLAILVLLAALEALLRVFGKETYTEFLTRFHADQVRLNAQGFRDVEVTTKKPKNIFRVLVLGDSFTFGVGVSDFEKIYSRQLESLLRASGRDVEVVTRAMPGWSSFDEYQYMKNTGFAYEPDLVVVGYVMNDPDHPDILERNYTPARGFVIWGRFDAALILGSRLYNLVWTRWNRALERFGVKETYSAWEHRFHDPTREPWQRETQTLQDLSREISASGAKGVLVILPVFSDFEQYDFAQEHAQVREAAERAGFLVMDMLPEFFGRRARDFWVYPIDPHPNEEAQGIFAQGLYKFLIEGKLVP